MLARLNGNLNFLMGAKRITANQLARCTGIPASTIKKIRQSSQCNPTVATLIPIAKFFSISLDQLVCGTQMDDDLVNSLPPSEISTLPLICWSNAISCPKSNSKHQKIVSTHKFSTKAFALLVEANIGLIFPIGTVVLIEPEIDPDNYDYLVVCKKGSSIPNVKQFLIEDGCGYLKSINVDKHIVPQTIEYQILGVIVEYHRKIKVSDSKNDHSTRSNNEINHHKT